MAAIRKFTAAELVAMIRAKYSGAAYTVMEQVADGTGAGATSWIDAAVFSLWPSNGIWRAACEVKVSRADFIDELTSPNKNQWAREHFDFFWYVVGPGVAKDDEVPTGCGLMVVRGNGLSVQKQAPRREDVITDKWIIASFARSLDKERERFVRDVLKEAMESSREYREAKWWQEGAERYVRHCDEYCHPDSADDVFDKLIKLSRDKTPQSAEASHAQEVLERFQDNVLEFLLDVAPLAANALNARDSVGDFIVRTYGYRDERCVEALRQSLKKRRPKYSRLDRKDVKRAIEVRELIASNGDTPTPSAPPVKD